jgi:hypothetical protein
MITVKLWTGKKTSYPTVDIAKREVKNLLSRWMNDDDYIGFHHDYNKITAVVYDVNCEPTDVFAEIK